MKKIVITALTYTASICLLSACGNSDFKEWSTGYQAALNGEKVPSSFWDSKEKQLGYAQALDDIDAYDDGYYDARKGNKPIYYNDAYYMDGYKDGKKDKRY